MKSAVIPLTATDDTISIIMMGDRFIGLAACILANLNSLVFDFVARQKVSGLHLRRNVFVQLPVLAPNHYTLEDQKFVQSRAIELTYTSYSLKPFAMDLGYEGPPFAWDPDRRAHLCAELDAYFARLYGLSRDDLRYILDPCDIYGADYPSETFRVLKEREVKEYREYRTQRLVLEAWDRLERGEVPEVSPAIGVAQAPSAPVELVALPDGALARPMQDQRTETGALLAALLKAMDGPLPTWRVRLAAAVALEPRLLLPYLDNREAAIWRRLIGTEADLPSNDVTQFVARTNQAWGAAVRNLRGNGQLVEDIRADTWAPGAGLGAFSTSGWPEGRARMVFDVLSRFSADEVVAALPDELQGWVNAAAA